MSKISIQVPEKGTYKANLFNYWSDEYRLTRAGHVAYIALNFAGALDAARAKLAALNEKHAKLAACERGGRHAQAIARLKKTMTGQAVAYESGFKH